MQAVMILRGNEPTWAEAKRQLGELRAWARSGPGLAQGTCPTGTLRNTAQEGREVMSMHENSLGGNRNWLLSPQPKDKCSKAVRTHCQGQECLLGTQVGNKNWLFSLSLSVSLLLFVCHCPAPLLFLCVYVQCVCVCKGQASFLGVPQEALSGFYFEKVCD